MRGRIDACPHFVEALRASQSSLRGLRDQTIAAQPANRDKLAAVQIAVAATQSGHDRVKSVRSLAEQSFRKLADDRDSQISDPEALQERLTESQGRLVSRAETLC